jgi:hypothetical protein
MTLRLLDHAARNAFGNMSGTTDMFLVPKFRFNFEVTLFINNDPTIFQRVATVNLPTMSFETQNLNQYNIKRIVQTKASLGPCVIEFYDTINNDFMDTVIRPYYANYYTGGLGLSDTSSNGGEVAHNNDSVIVDQFSTLKGLILAPNKYFINKIEIAQRHRADGSHESPNRITTFKNCIITNIDTENLDYSASEPCKFTVTFEPESMFVKNEGE